MTTPARVEALRKALCNEKVRDIIVPTAEAVAVAARERPSLLVLEDAMDNGAPALARAIQDTGTDLPIIVVTARHEDEPFGHSGVTYLAEPFSPSYARALLHAALMRRACRWVRAGRPPDEAERIAALHRLNVLDTAPEERFDRITRLAAALFEVPIALISLIDVDRQWIKSACGLDVHETPRDESFCAHAVLSRVPLIVPDALLDDRFAENPFVVDMPRIRFYAGHPLFVSDGNCIGTLCLIDTRPRQLDERDIALLRDMAQLATSELEHHPFSSRPSAS